MGGVRAPGNFGTKISFVVLLGVILIAIILQDYAADKIDISNWTNDCPSGKDDLCRRNGFILRTSFALCVLFTVHGILTFAQTSMYDEFWGGKIIIFIGIFIAFVFLPAQVFDTHGYAWFARIASFFFLIFQQII